MPVIPVVLIKQEPILFIAQSFGFGSVQPLINWPQTNWQKYVRVDAHQRYRARGRRERRKIIARSRMDHDWLVKAKLLCSYRVIQVTVFFNFSLTDTKKLKNGKTQPFLFRIYVDILIFWCLSMARWKNLAFQDSAKTVWVFHHSRDEHRDNPPDTCKHLRYP